VTERRLVDGMNVIGSRPDGWWRDRRGAITRLAEALRGLDEPVCVVFDGRPWDGAPEDGDGLSVRFAPGGRGAADDEIVRMVEADADPASLRVVTSDGALAARVRAAGATVEGAGGFRRRLDRPGSPRP
jgi:predicted RNA-binding protein with PIN domain